MKTASASLLRKPAVTSFCCSLPISDGDFGAKLPIFFNVSTVKRS